MKSPTATQNPRRPYRQTARADAAEATGRRILDAFADAMRSAWLEDITLDEVASAAGVTVQTVIRRFGGKDGLLAASRDHIGEQVRADRKVPVGDLERAIANLCDDYENSGDMLIRLLAQEQRFPVLDGLLGYGRAEHRAWVSQVCAPWLEPLGGQQSEAALDALVASLDVYVWKLARRDMSRSREETQRLILRLARGVIQQIQAESPGGTAP
jgi:AcrR family transcriptional regulator